MYDTTGVSLGLSHGASSSSIKNFDAQNYAQGWICAASKISMTNVNLGAGFTNNHRFDIDPYCGAVQVPQEQLVQIQCLMELLLQTCMFRTFPGTANDTVTNEFKIADFSASGSPTDAVEFTNADVGSKFIIDGCDANVMLMTYQLDN